jgi:hypothetical protein
MFPLMEERENKVILGSVCVSAGGLEDFGSGSVTANALYVRAYNHDLLRAF